ncbi:MAG: response regulator transcription factor [Polyangiaceae bacterium]|jgi:DNA-binding response OmpR family regulator
MDSDSPAKALSVVYIEDDARIARLLARYLESHGVAVSLAPDGPTGIAEVARLGPDVILLDVMLPGIDGLEVCRRLRTKTSAPILMVTACGEEADRVVGLEGGADDYIVKPFSSRELLARIRAHARRAQGKIGPTSPKLKVGALTIDATAMRACWRGEDLALTTYEFMLLHALAERAGRVMSRESLVELVRGSPDEAFDRSIDVHVSHLRQKLGDDPRNPAVLKTVRGAGYMVVDDCE